MDQEVDLSAPEGGMGFKTFCLKCSKVYDACSASWCECITDTPTLVCPHCGCCFCDASPEARKAFWSAAPRALWERRLHNFYKELGEPPSEIGNPLRRPLILVADDDEDTRRVAFRALEELGYGVLLATDGTVAFKLAVAFQPDLILADHMMPRLDGVHLCSKIKRDRRTKQMVVILMSGLYKRESHRIEALKVYGADDYLMKPIAFDRLGQILESWLAPPARDV